MDEMIRFAQMLPGVPEFPLCGIEQFVMGHYADPESVSEVKNEFHFAAQGMHYIVRFHKPDVDSEMLEYDFDDFYRMFYSGELSEAQATVIENAGFSISLMRIDSRNKKAELLHFDQSCLQANAVKARDLDAWVRSFSGSNYSWSHFSPYRSSDRPNVEAEMDHLLQEMDLTGPIEDPKPIILDIFSKFCAAASVYKERCRQYEKMIADSALH